MMSAQEKEKVLRKVEKSVDRTWGGYCVLHFTDRRLIVEKIGVTPLQAFTPLPSLLVEVFAGWRAKRKRQDVKHPKDTPEYILASHRKNYALNYDEIAKVTLKRKIATWGYSELKIESKQKEVNLGFKKEAFDALASLLANVVGPDKVEVM